MTTDTRNIRLFLEGRFVDRLNVASSRGVEEANRLYRIHVDFTTDAIDDHLEERLVDRGPSQAPSGSASPRSIAESSPPSSPQKSHVTTDVVVLPRERRSRRHVPGSSVGFRCAISR